MKAAIALCLVSSLAFAEPADAPVRPAVAVLEGQPMPFNGVAMDDAMALQTGRRIAKCEAEIEAAQTKTLVSTPVLVGGIIAVVAVVAGAFGAGYAVAALKK